MLFLVALEVALVFPFLLSAFEQPRALASNLGVPTTPLLMAAHLSPQRAPSTPPEEDAQASYTYQPLPLGEWFRLLRVHPGSPGDHLCCELISCSLKDAPPYKALSYVWGNMVMDSEITCSGHSMFVTSNLLQCLRRIRDPHQGITVWADAICIDQSAAVERGHQVDLMGKIYATADEVLVWLGEDDQDSAEHAFRSLIDINNAIQVASEHILPTTTDEFRLAQHYAHAFESVESMITSNLNAKQKDAVGTLYNLSWFKRVWVLQEVGLARVATAIWGSSKIDFAQIALFISFCNTIGSLQQILGPDISESVSGAPYHAVWNVWCTFGNDGWLYETLPLRHLASWIASSGNIDFVLVLEASRLFEATNALDHIYAFLGHPQARFGSDQLFSADYSMQVADLNRDVASVLARQSLNFLVQVQHQVDDDSTSNDTLPSWVPQWDILVQGSPDAYWEWWDASRRIANSNGTRFSIFEDRLTIPVLFIGAINLRTDIMTKEDLNASRSKLGEILEMCWDLTEAAEEVRPSNYKENELGALAAALSSYCESRGTMEYWVSQFCKLCSICNNTLYVEKISKHKGSQPISTEITRTEERNMEATFGGDVKYYCRNRRFFTTENGYWGLGPPGLQPGDVCVIIYGADVPFVLRPIPGCSQYKLVGQCYISGAMYGEMLATSPDGTDISEWTNITLV